MEEVHGVWVDVRLVGVELEGSPDDASYGNLFVLVGAGVQYAQPKATYGAHGVLLGGAPAPHAPPRVTYVHGDPDHPDPRENEVEVAF